MPLLTHTSLRACEAISNTEVHKNIALCIRIFIFTAVIIINKQTMDNNNTGGFEQFEVKEKPNSVFLIILCSLTILGAVISLVSLPFNGAATAMLNIEYPTYLLVLGAVVAVGKLGGAIFMLMKKIKGLYIYTAAAILSIIVSIYTNLIITYPVAGSAAITYIGMAFGILISIVFIVLYWLPVNRRVLS